MDTNILLESGTNELEILIFKIAGNYYGINVAKITSILVYKEPVPVPNSHPCIEGLITYVGDDLITVINLPRVLNLPESEDKKQDFLLATSFNQLQVAFHVQGVEGIQRIFWTDITKPDRILSGEADGMATGVIRFKNKLVLILDFEKIAADIRPDTGIQESRLEQLGTRSMNYAPILYAEDSSLLSRRIHDCLTKAGYVNLTQTSSGLEAWNLLQKYKEEGTLKEKVACVVTDIEMPQMDGHHLTKLIKEDPVLQDIPVIIFSSLISDEMIRKGNSVGVDAQFSKAEVDKLIESLDGFLADWK